MGLTFDLDALAKPTAKQLKLWDHLVATTRTTEPPSSVIDITSERTPKYWPVGLWVRGDRGSGSSYVAYNAWKRANWQRREEIANAEFAMPRFIQSQITATELIELLKTSWNLSTLAQHNSQDGPLMDDLRMVHQRLEWFFDISPSVFLDDLHHDFYDGMFWKKHIWHRLERKVKSGQVVVVATDMDAERVFGKYWKKIFTGCPVPDAER